jgi:RNA polymerase sigma-70 factor (ECF subfamily)
MVLASALSTFWVAMTCRSAVDDFEGWYRRVHPRVIGAVFACCGDRDVAADATDEAFARAVDRWARVSVMSSPEAWVSRVAVNSMRRRLRRRGLERRFTFRHNSAEGIDEHVPYPEVWRAVRSLPERQRVAIVLRYVADLTELEVSQAMGVARGTVSALLVTARSNLSRSLQTLDDRNNMEARDA